MVSRSAHTRLTRQTRPSRDADSGDDRDPSEMWTHS
jgi:hypothetical protein